MILFFLIGILQAPGLGNMCCVHMSILFTHILITGLTVHSNQWRLCVWMYSNSVVLGLPNVDLCAGGLPHQ